MTIVSSERRITLSTEPSVVDKPPLSTPERYEAASANPISQDRVDAYLEKQQLLLNAIDAFEAASSVKDIDYLTQRQRTIEAAFCFITTMKQNHETDCVTLPDGNSTLMQLGSLGDMGLLAHTVDALGNDKLRDAAHQLLVPEDGVNTPPLLSDTLRTAYQRAGDNGSLVMDELYAIEVRADTPDVECAEFNKRRCEQEEIRRAIARTLILEEWLASQKHTTTNPPSIT